MTKLQNPISLRLSPEVRAYLAARTKSSGRSLNNEIREMIAEKMPRHPIWANVTEVPEGENGYYVVTLGHDPFEYFKGDREEEAIAAAKEKLKEFGCPSASIKFWRQLPY